MGPASLGILADGRWQGRHGIGRFATEVLRRLPRHTRLERGPKPLSLADPLWLAWQVMARRPAVYFSPGFNPPPLCPTPLVFTLHDLIHVQESEVATAVKRAFYEIIVRPAARRAFRVLTVSEDSRSRIIAWANLPEERVVNVGNGVDAPFHPEGPRYDPGYPYLLYVGNFRPHKNIPRLLQAFGRVGHPDLRLLFSGSPNDAILAPLQRFGILQKAGFLHNPPDARLASAYRGAALVVMPSLTEGFGLPALEAMACGTPVVVSRCPALLEIVGEAGLLVDPLDVRDIGNAIERALRDRELRRTLSCRGLDRAAQFSWDRVAGQVRAILEQAAGSGD